MDARNIRTKNSAELLPETPGLQDVEPGERSSLKSDLAECDDPSVACGDISKTIGNRGFAGLILTSQTRGEVRVNRVLQKIRDEAGGPISYSGDPWGALSCGEDWV